METMLLPWGLCLQVKSLTLAASHKPTCYSCEQKLKDRAHSHAQEGTTAVQGKNAEELTGQKQRAAGLEPRVHTLDDCCYHLRYRAEEVIQGKKQLKPSQMLCLAMLCLKDNWGDWTDWVMQDETMQSARGRGTEKQKNGWRCEALDSSGLDKMRHLKNNWNSPVSHLFLSSPSPTPYSLWVAVGCKALANLSCHGLKAVPKKFILLPHSSVQPVVIPVSF